MSNSPDLGDDLDELLKIVEAVATNEPYYTADGIDTLCVFCDAEVVETLPTEYDQHHETCPYRLANEYLDTSTLHYEGTFPMAFLRENETVRHKRGGGIIIAAMGDGILRQTHINLGQTAKRKADGSIEVTDE